MVEIIRIKRYYLE